MPKVPISSFRRRIARQLRGREADPERKLWHALRDVPVYGSHFRRQVPIGRYVVDFACLRAKLVIELDGGQHSDDRAARRDAARTACLEREGYRVLRFWNPELCDNLRGVLDTVYAALYGSLNAEPRSFDKTQRPPSP